LLAIGSSSRPTPRWSTLKSMAFIRTS